MRYILLTRVYGVVQASAQVEDLQKNLVEEQKIVAEKKEKTGALIEAIGKEKVQVPSVARTNVFCAHHTGGSVPCIILTVETAIDMCATHGFKARTSYPVLS